MPAKKESTVHNIKCYVGKTFENSWTVTDYLLSIKETSDGSVFQEQPGSLIFATKNLCLCSK